jgi:hypothetical protein
MSLSELQDQLALTKHINTYGWLADMMDWQALSALFTDDTIFEFKISDAPNLGVCLSHPGRSSLLIFRC